MGHCIQIFLGSKDVLDSIHNEFNESKVIPLTQGIALLPMTDDLYDAIPNPDEIGPKYDGFMFLDRKVMDLLIRKSKFENVGYLETEYFGGMGDQGAVLAKNGQIIFGPQVGAESINKMLSLMGIETAGEDEFEVIGLGQFRDNEDWLKYASQEDH